MALEVWRLTFFSMFYFLSTSPEKFDAGFSVHRLTVCSGMSLASSVEASVVQGKWSSKEGKENRRFLGESLEREGCGPSRAEVYVNSIKWGAAMFTYLLGLSG